MVIGNVDIDNWNVCATGALIRSRLFLSRMQWMIQALEKVLPSRKVNVNLTSVTLLLVPSQPNANYNKILIIVL